MLWLNSSNNRLYYCGKEGWTPLNDENIRIDDVVEDVDGLAINVSTLSGNVTTISNNVAAL